MADLKLIIRESILRVKNGQGTDHDKAIYMLLEQNKKYQDKIKELKESGGGDVPIHRQTPWYMVEDKPKKR